MLIMPTHVTEVEINPKNFSQKHFFLKAANLEAGKAKNETRVHFTKTV